MFLAFSSALHAVHEERLSHQIEKRHAWIEGSERILKDHLHLSTQRAQLLPAQPPHLDHRAIGGPHEDLPARRLDGPHDAPRGGRLPAAAFSHEAESLSFVDVKVDAVHRADVADRPLPEALPDREELLELGDAQEDAGGELAHG